MAQKPIQQATQPQAAPPPPPQPQPEPKPLSATVLVEITHGTYGDPPKRPGDIVEVSRREAESLVANLVAKIVE